MPKKIEKVRIFDEPLINDGEIPEKTELSPDEVVVLRAAIDERISQFRATRRLDASDFAVIINARDDDIS